MDKLEAVLEKNPNLKVIHRLNRPELGYSLIFFGNPKLGSPLMLKSQYTGLDLPQRMLIFNDNSGGSFVCYNSMRYLNSAYGLEDHPNLEKAKNGLSNLVTSLTDKEPHLVQNARFGRNKGIRKMTSPLNFRDSYQLIFEKISKEGYKVEKTLDHGENGRKAGFEMLNERLILVNDAEMEKRLYDLDPSLMLDLWPLKFLVVEEPGGKVKVGYHHLGFHFERRKLNTNSDLFINLRRFQSSILRAIKDAPHLPTQEDEAA